MHETFKPLQQQIKFTGQAKSDRFWYGAYKEIVGF